MLLKLPLLPLARRSVMVDKIITKPIARDLRGFELLRRLAEAGVAYQALLDSTRHELACHYLATSAMPIAEVGYLLGYQDAPAFHHAFKQWQGQGPGQYRAQTRASG